MTDKALMKRLGAVAGELQQRDRLEALAAGALSPQEVAELRQQAASSGTAASAYEAHRPLDRALRDRLLQCAQAELRLACAPRWEVEYGPPRSGTRRSDAAPAPDCPQRRSRRRRPA